MLCSVVDTWTVSPVSIVSVNIVVMWFGNVSLEGGERASERNVSCVSECYEQISKCLIIVKENTETCWGGDLLKALFTLLRGTSFSRANRRHQEPLCL